MRLTENDLKIKCSPDNLRTLLNYLNEIADNSDLYLKLFLKKATYNIYNYHLNGIREKVIKLLFNNAGTGKALTTLKLSHAERIVLYDTGARYPLPLDINFIEYEIKNRLLI